MSFGLFDDKMNFLLSFQFSIGYFVDLLLIEHVIVDVG